MITSCIAIIFGFRFFGRGLHEISGEEMVIIAFFMLFLFVPCLWLVRYLKDDEIDSNRQDKLVEIHIALTIVLTVAGGVFSRMSVLVNKWIDEQPFIVSTVTVRQVMTLKTSMYRQMVYPATVSTKYANRPYRKETYC